MAPRGVAGTPRLSPGAVGNRTYEGLVAPPSAILPGAGRATPAIHASVQRRVAVDPSYAERLPASHAFVDPDWTEPKPLKPLKAKRPRARRTIDLDEAGQPVNNR